MVAYILRLVRSDIPGHSKPHLTLHSSHNFFFLIFLADNPLVYHALCTMRSKLVEKRT